jgi:hypothetical protein
MYELRVLQNGLGLRRNATMNLAIGLVVESKRRLSRQPLGVKATMRTCREVVMMVAGARVFTLGGVGDGEKIFGDDHLAGNAGTEILNLATDVAEEGVAGPTAYQHDRINRDVGEVHGHGRSGSDGMGAHLPGREAQDILAYGGDAVPDPKESLFRGDQADGTVGA